MLNKVTLRNIIKNKINVGEVDETTLFLILDNHKYDFNKIYKNMSKKRYFHSVSVTKTALKIAKSNNLDDLTINKVFIASILHDIAKDLNNGKTLRLMEKYFKDEINNVHPVVYHQFTGSLLANKIYKIKDEEILNTIKYHTTGIDNMCLIGKIVYCSDKIEPTRGYDSKYMIDECCNNIEEGFILVVNENIKFLKEKDIKFDSYTLRMINFYLN